MDGVVVAVPEDWGTAVEPCALPERDTVAFLDTASTIIDCGERATDGFSMLGIAAAGSGAIPLGRHVDIGADVDGLSIMHSGISCTGGASRSCEATLRARGSAAVFRVVGHGRDARTVVQTVHDSVRRLPDGFVTVPFIAFGTSLERTRQELADAGLETLVPDVDFPYYVTGTLPAAGTVVERGADIALEIGDG